MGKTMKNLSLVTIATSIVLLTGCGRGSDKNPMNDKKVIAILKNVPSGICESQVFRDNLSEDYRGLLTEERRNTVNCGDYGRKNNGIECAVGYYSGTYTGNVACVMGADGRRYNKQAKIVEGSTYSNTVDAIDIIDTKFIQVAE